GVIDMRILLDEHDHIGGLDHRRRQVTVRIEQHAYLRAGSEDGACSAEDVALAVITARRHHGAMEEKERDVERLAGAQLRQDLLAILLVDPLQGRPGRLGVGEEAFHESVAVARGQLFPDPGEHARLIVTAARGGIAAEGADFRESTPARRPWGEGIGLGDESRREHTHALSPIFQLRKNFLYAKTDSTSIYAGVSRVHGCQRSRETLPPAGH